MYCRFVNNLSFYRHRVTDDRSDLYVFVMVCNICSAWQNVMAVQTNSAVFLSLLVSKWCGVGTAVTTVVWEQLWCGNSCNNCGVGTAVVWEQL